MRGLAARRGGSRKSDSRRGAVRHAGSQTEPSARVALPWLGIAPSAHHPISLLTDVPTEYQLQGGIQLAAQLAKALLLAKVADPTLWPQIDGKPLHVR